MLHLRLGLRWEEVHEEPDRLEHELSDELAARIFDELGQPEADPHGAPIPPKGAKGDDVEEIAGEPLRDLPAGTKGVLVRVVNLDPEMLVYLSEQGIGIKDSVEVIDHQPFGGSVLLQVDKRDTLVPIGRELASLMRIKRHGSSRTR